MDNDHIAGAGKLMSDAPAAPTLGEIVRVANSLRGYAKPFRSLHRDIADDFQNAADWLESQSAEIAEYQALQTRASSVLDQVQEALTAANARNARLTEALRKVKEWLDYEDESKFGPTELALLRKLDAQIDAALDAQPEQGVENG